MMILEQILEALSKDIITNDPNVAARMMQESH